MELRGRLIDIVKDILTGAFRITLEVWQIPTGIDALRDFDLRISLKKWREKRSLTANAYYWVLVGKIADAIHQPQSVVHNVLLCNYGVLDIAGGENLSVLIPDTEEAANEVLRKETYHLRPTSHIVEGKRGNLRVYKVIRGSSYYDTKQFSTLLEGAISECRQMGLETLPDNELERMMQDYEKHYGHG